MTDSNTNTAEMSEENWKTARELRIEEARASIRNLMATEPEKVIDLILASVDVRMANLRNMVSVLYEKMEAIEAHRHQGDAILVPLHLPTHNMSKGGLGIQGGPQSAEPSWARIMQK